MNAKFVLAVCLALQVSLCLCDLTPDQDLVEKYDAMKAKFMQRLVNMYNKVQAAAADNPNAQAAKDAIAGNERVSTAKEVALAIGQEVSPMVDAARSNVLGFYSAYLRPAVGQYLQQGIDQIKVVLDQVMPAEN